MLSGGDVDCRTRLCLRGSPSQLVSPPTDCIHHTDRGSQYWWYDYQKILRGHGYKLSMIGKGNCYDNATIATFFKTIMAELIWRQYWTTRRAAELEFFNDINGA